jgi:Na+-transporting NADH:ubiquinone oxidoreductase subunit D
MPSAQLKQSGRAFITQLWQDNPVFRQVLGICSALAVTNRLVNTLLMCGGLIWAQVMSSVTVSLLRDLIPRRVRMIVQVLIISVYVICVDIALKAWFPEIHREIAAYVGLIITNCIIMGRLEAYASKNRPLPSLLDGLGAGLGYSIVLIAVATVRELLGFGTLLGLGAFFVLALWVWAARSYAMRRGAAPAGKEGQKK